MAQAFLRRAIEGVIDMDLYQHEIEAEARDAVEVKQIRAKLKAALSACIESG